MIMNRTLFRIIINYKILVMSKLNKRADIVLNGDELKRMLKDYEYDPVTEFWDEDGDERAWVIKRALSQLDVSERLIFVLYLETQSERDLGQLLGCSRTPVSRELKKIKEKIRSMMGKNGEKGGDGV